MKEIGTPVDKARMLAGNLSEADFRGHFSHGLNRLAYYVADIKKGIETSRVKTNIMLMLSMFTVFCCFIFQNEVKQIDPSF